MYKKGITLICVEIAKNGERLRYWSWGRRIVVGSCEGRPFATLDGLHRYNVEPKKVEAY